MKKLVEQRKFYNRYLKNKHAFTMAEILISLTIIGVIAAITLPALKASINESTWNTKRKALYTRISQAISMMGSLNGYGLSTDDDETNANAAMAFVTEGLNKVLKINNICDKNNLSKCGISNKITNMANSKVDFPTTLWGLNGYFSQNDPTNNNTDAIAFETVNGESVAVFYNPLCKNDSKELDSFITKLMCANFIYDLNGKKGPNRVGKDIGFITALYPTEPSVVAPMPLATDANNGNPVEVNGFQAFTAAAAACEAQDENSRLPNVDELAAMEYNRGVCLGGTSTYYWSGSISPRGTAWVEAWFFRRIASHPTSTQKNYRVRCIKR